MEENLEFNKRVENLVMITETYSYMRFQEMKDKAFPNITPEELVKWANEFEDSHLDTDWCELDYIEAIDGFAREKVNAYFKEC